MIRPVKNGEIVTNLLTSYNHFHGTPSKNPGIFEKCYSEVGLEFGDFKIIQIPHEVKDVCLASLLLFFWGVGWCPNPKLLSIGVWKILGWLG